jgi:hypothetical protein
VHCKYKFTRSHAHLFHFVKNPLAFTFHHSDIRVPSARQLVYGDRRAESSGRLPDDTWILRPQDCPEAFSEDENTWYFPQLQGRLRSGLDITAARCRNSCWPASSVPVPPGRCRPRPLRRQRLDTHHREKTWKAVHRLRAFPGILNTGNGETGTSQRRRSTCRIGKPPAECG